MLHYLWMFVVGVVAGAVARVAIPGPGSSDLLMRGILSVLGSLIGSLIASMLGTRKGSAQIRLEGLVFSIVGALTLLVAWDYIPR